MVEKGKLNFTDQEDVMSVDTEQLKLDDAIDYIRMRACTTFASMLKPARRVQLDTFTYESSNTIRDQQKEIQSKG